MWHATQRGVDPRIVALLERLATYPTMRTVWPKLAAADAGDIVRIVLLAEAAARGIRPPLPKRKQEYSAYVKKFPPEPPSPAGISILLARALAGMREHQVAARHLWSDLWPGEAGMTFDRVISVMSAMATFGRSLEAKYQAAAAGADPLPQFPRKRGSRTAGQTYFAVILSDYFCRSGGSPLDDVVSALSCVTFDDPSGGPSAAVVRSRRRAARRDQTHRLIKPKTRRMSRAAAADM